MLKPALRMAGILTLLTGLVVALAPAQAQAKTRDCTPRPSADLAGCNYANADLLGANFSGSDLRGADVSGADLNNTNFTNADLRRANLSGAGIVFDCRSASDVCPGSGNVFGDSWAVSPNLSNADLHGSNLTSARLGGGTIGVGQICIPHQPCIEIVDVYPSAILTGARSGGTTGTPASLPSGWELVDGYLTPIIPPPTITTTSLPMGTVKAPYSAALTASGGNPPYSWSAMGTLPPGLHIHKKLGTITGGPKAAGTYSFTIVVEDSKTAAAPHTQRTASKLLAITVQ